MNKGALATLLLSSGCLLRLLGLIIDLDDPGVQILLSLLGIILWMAGSFTLAVHLRLHPLWGLAGLFFILGLIVLVIAGNQRRSSHRHRHHHRPHYDPPSGEPHRRRSRRTRDDIYDY